MSGPPLTSPAQRAAMLSALTPVHDAVLARARADAAAALAAAEAEVAAAVSSAQEQADASVAEARAQGAAAGEVVLATERAAARRRARGIVLRAQREVYEDLRRRCLDSVRALRSDPSYPLLRARLVSRVRDVLGPHAEVLDDPDSGVVGLAPGRRVDLSAAALTDRAIASLGSRIEQLWDT